MKRKIDLTSVTLWANRCIALILSALLFALPSILDWYCTVRHLAEVERMAIMVAFYCCAVVVGFALWHIDCLLRCIRRKEIFIRANVKRIRTVQWCCALVSVICLPAALIYYPLMFLVVIMGFLCLVVSVVSRVMDEAVTIREENDLTV